MDSRGSRGNRGRGNAPRGGGGGRGGPPPSGRGQPPRDSGPTSGPRGGYSRDNQGNRGSRGGFHEGQPRRSDAYQSSTGHGYQQDRPQRGGFQSSRTQIHYSSEPLALDRPHVDGPQGFKCPGQEFPAEKDLLGFKALIPKNMSPGELYQRKVHLKVNFFLAQITLPEKLFRYEVKITKHKPESDDKKKKSTEGSGDQQEMRPPNKELRVKIFKWLVPRIRNSWAEVNRGVRLPLIHDFSEIMVTTKPLETVVDFEYVVHHSGLEDEDDSDFYYHIKISNTGLNLNLPRLQGMLDNLRDFTGDNEPQLAAIEQFYNILIKNIGGDTYLPLGRNSLMRIPENERNADLGAGLCNWQGITATYTMGSSWKPYINIEIQNSAFRIGQRVDEAVEDVLQDSRNRNRNFRLDDVTTWRNEDFNAVSDLLRSCKVTRMVGGRRMDGVVRGVVQEPPSNISFPCEEFNNEVLTVPQYFERKYNLEINPQGLLLQIGAKAKVPSEFCTIKMGQSYNRMLTNETVTRNMLARATQKPDVKERNIRRAIEDLQMTRNNILEDFGVNFNDEMLDLKATRVLGAPELCYGIDSRGRQQQGGIPSRGRITPQNGEWDQWNHKVQFFKPMKIDYWAILILDDNRSDPSRFISELRNNGQNIGGMTIPQPSEVIKRGDISERGNPGANIGEIAKILTQLGEQFPENQKSFVLVVIPRKLCSLYNQVKQAAELHANIGVLTQCVIKKNFDAANHSVVKNILLKVNCKLGGINHVPVIPKHLNGIDILKTPAMIVGIDVNHPPAGQGNKIAQPSFAAVTASIDRSGMPYMMYIQAQMKAERGAAEVVQNLENIMLNMIRGFYIHIKKNTGQMVKPSKIIVYRDGVGTGQFPEVLDVELRAIRKACERMKDDDGNVYRPKITIIAVQKRHKVRFFLKNPETGSTENAPPGTVVDTEIVNSDFYLLSHRGMLGTSRPTHYQVLWDDSDFSSDEIQALSYYLCYMYSRCNKAVSYPAPTYYAHWAAKRANVLCKMGGQLPNWWDGTQESLDIMNRIFIRNRHTMSSADYPMHFV